MTGRPDPDHDAEEALADDQDLVRESSRPDPEKIRIEQNVKEIGRLGWDRPRLMAQEECPPEPGEPDGLTRMTFQSDPVSDSARSYGAIQVSCRVTREALVEVDAGKINLLDSVSEAMLELVQRLAREL